MTRDKTKPAKPRPPGKEQKEIAREMGISQGRVYQLEKRAMAKLRKIIAEEASKAGVTPEEWLRG